MGCGSCGHRAAERERFIFVVVDVVGIFVFAITGALVAVRRQFDIFGVLVLAGTTGLGGGFLRDVLIDATPPAALADWRYVLVPVVAGLVTFFFHPAFGRMERTVNVLDAAGLAFLGLGITPPTAEWGVLVSEGSQRIISGEWWVWLFPGLAIVLAAFAFSLIGDGLRDLNAREEYR